MKRMLMVLFSALLACALIASALAAAGDAMLTEDVLNRLDGGMCAIGDALWLENRQCVTRYDALTGTSETYPWSDDILDPYGIPLPDGSGTRYTSIQAWFAWRGEPCALLTTTLEDETQDVELCRVNIEGGVATLERLATLDWRDFCDSDYFQVSSCFALNDTLCALVGSEAFGEELCLIPLDGGKAVRTGLGFAEICPYEDYILGATDDERSDDAALLLTVVDPATGRSLREKRLSLEDSWLSGIAQEPGSLRLLFVQNGALVALDPATEALETIAGFPRNPSNGSGGASACVLDSGLYAGYIIGDGVVLRALFDRQPATTKLTVSAYYSIDCLLAASYHCDPDTEITLKSDSSGEELLNQLLTRNSDVDIYVVPSDFDTALGSILDRGWAAELDSAPLSDYLRDMYPALAERFTRDGRPVAIPLEASANGMGLNVGAMQALGLSMDDVPASWPEFCAWLNRAAAMAQHAKPVFMDDAEYTKLNLLATLFEQCAREIALGALPDFDAAPVRAAVAALEAIDFDAICASDAELWQGNGWPGNPLFSCYNSLAIGESNWSDETDYYPLLLSLDAQSPERLPVSAVCAIVNPFSENIPAATAFLESAIDYVEPQTRAMLSPVHGAPLRDEAAYEASRAETDAEIRRLEARIAEGGSDAQALEALLEEQRQVRERIENWYWIISAESLDWYRAHDSHLTPDFAGAYEEIRPYPLIQQYVQGQLSLDELLKSLNDKVQMRMLEGY